MDKETGGSAFPSGDHPESRLYADAGMTLRDYFAAKAMASLTTVYWEDFDTYSSGAELIKCLCETAYEMADAMLAQRSQP